MPEESKEEGEILQKISVEISKYSGIKMSLRLIQKLKMAIEQRMKLKSIPNIKTYSTPILLGSPDGKREMMFLIEHLVNKETSFFRDAGHMHALREKILPEIIVKHQTDKEIKIWSAGCSTGQETYSLAYLIQQVLPNWADWKIFILGSDISQSAINEAQKGIYKKSGIHRVEQKDLSKLFISEKEDFFVQPPLRQMVTFRCSNLVTDSFPALDPHLFNVDLIICRNVFIYFPPEKIDLVVKKFSQVLAVGGRLMTGHAELIGVTSDLKMELTDSAVFFKKLKTT